MPITLTLAELIASKETWQKLIVAELPIKTAYWIGKKYRKIEGEMADYEKKHNELVTKYGKPVEGKPGVFQVSPENMEAFMKDVSDLRSVEVQIDIDLIKLADIETIHLTGRDFMLLEKFIEE